MQKLEDIAPTKGELARSKGLPPQIAIGFIRAERKLYPFGGLLDTHSNFNGVRFS